MTHATPEEKKAALEFMKEHQAGVLATVDADGQPHASAVYYLCDDDFNIYFLTPLNTRKSVSIKKNPKVAFVVGRQDAPQTVQLEGVAQEIQYEEEKTKKVSDLVGVLMGASKFYPPITKLDKAEIVLYWIQPKWVRWADYTMVADGSENVWKEIPLK